MQIDSLNMDNQLEIRREYILINQGAVTVDFHTPMRNYLSNRESKRGIKNHLLIQENLTISIMSAMDGS